MTLSSANGKSHPDLERGEDTRDALVEARERDDDLAVEHLKPSALLRDFDAINICAPMVRYSKLPFRQLVSQYDCHVNFTPMMLAQEFSRSAIARDADFSTSSTERGTFILAPSSSTSTTSPSHSLGKQKRKVRGSLIAQFAAHSPEHLADAAELVAPYVDGVDLNCGCPQPWAYKDGVGSALLRDPDRVRDLVRAAKARCGPAFEVSVKIRIDDDLKRTEQLVQTAVHAGASFLTVHGRTRHQSSWGVPVSLDGIKFAVECAKNEIPVCANGDVFTLEDAERTRRETGVRGVMSARGLLANPALFSGFSQTPLAAVSDFVKISTSTGLLYPLFHRHMAYMLESHLPIRRDRVYFNELSSYAGVCDFLEEQFSI